MATNKTTVTAELSESATGFRPIGYENQEEGKKTVYKLDTILIENNEAIQRIRVFYTEQMVSTVDESLKGPLVRKEYSLTDTPAVYEYEVDENGQEVEGSRTITKEEFLPVTEWNSVVGEIFEQGIVSQLKEINGHAE